jgi:acyl phosphate:glycerol-3-phosphate acyltransferase
MNHLYIALSVLAAYLIGSIPSAVWYGRSVFGLDVREHGSGNAGATNTLRVLGKKAAIIVMLADMLKGFLATSLAWVLYVYNFIPEDRLMMFKLLFGIIAIIGHVFPIYARFKGGKGVATLLGMGFALHAPATLICVVVFFLVLALSKYVSLGSMLGTLTFPLLLVTIPRFNPHEPLVIIFSFGLFAIVVLTHKKNIRRLINGEENKTFILKRRVV